MGIDQQLSFVAPNPVFAVQELFEANSQHLQHWPFDALLNPDSELAMKNCSLELLRQLVDPWTLLRRYSGD